MDPTKHSVEPFAATHRSTSTTAVSVAKSVHLALFVSKASVNNVPVLYLSNVALHAVAAAKRAVLRLRRV